MIAPGQARDTADAFHQFLSKFDPAFVGLPGAPQQLADVWRADGVSVESGRETLNNYLHVADLAGPLRETFLPGSLVADEAGDIGLLLNEGG